MSDADAFVRHVQMFFQEADVNEDHELDWEEFYDALPFRVKEGHPQETIRSWFDTADLDRNGKVSLGEFVHWSLTAASLVTGTAVTKLFGRHSGTANPTQLDEIQFTKCANALGFGRQAHELFHEFPLTSKGLLESRVITEATNQIRESSKTMKSFIIAMAWDNTEKDGVDTSNWWWTAEDVESARLSLANLLQKHGGAPKNDSLLWISLQMSFQVALLDALLFVYAARLSDLFEELDTSGDYYINADEFVTTMELTFGFKGPRQVLRDVFEHCDDDGSGELTFEELHAWLKGNKVTKHSRMEAVKQLCLRERITQLTTQEQRLGRDGELDVKSLRRELCAALKDANVRTTDLLDFWDKDADDKLNKKEWLRSWKKLVGLENSQWYSYVR